MRDDELAALHVGMIARDASAMAAFEAALRPVVRGMLRAKRLPDEDAEEVWNDAFLAAIERAPTIEPIGVGLRQFVLAVAHNRAVDRIRAAARNPHAPLEVAERPAQGGSSILDEGTAQAVRDCMAQLKPIYADVIEMTSRGLTAGEIAQVLEISEANAAKIRQRARSWLAECLKEVIS